MRTAVRWSWASVVVGLILVSPVRGEFVANGDFGVWAYYWIMENGATFNQAGNPPWCGVLQLGNSVIWQSISSVNLPADTDYRISLDGVTWNKAVGDPGLAVQMVYYHTGGGVTSDMVLSIPPAQLPEDWTHFTSGTFTTPADLDYTKIWIAKRDQVGGWVAVDNVQGSIIPKPVTVTGTAIPVSYFGDNTSVGLVVRLEPAGGGTAISRQVFLDSDGTFTLPEIPVGTYTVRVRGYASLQARQDGVTVSATERDLGTYNLLGADANGDDTISFEDFSVLQNNYGQSGSAGAGINPLAAATSGCGAVGMMLLALVGLAGLVWRWGSEN